MAGQGDPHLPRLFAPGVAVLIGYVLLVGNPWLSRDLTLALSGSDSAFRLATVMFTYPGWHLDVNSVGQFLFWFENLRTVLFVAFAVAGLTRVPRWVSGTAGGAGLFVTIVGVTAISAVISGLASAVVAVTLLDPQAALPDIAEQFFLGQLNTSASFGVLFGLVLGAVVAMRRRTPAGGKRRVNAPKSFW